MKDKLKGCLPTIIIIVIMGMAVSLTKNTNPILFWIGLIVLTLGGLIGVIALIWGIIVYIRNKIKSK